MRRILFILIFAINSFSAFSQEMWGISNSNYSGNMGIFLNPSTIVGAPYKYEVHVIGADIFAENTYIYFPKKEKIVIRSITGETTEGKKYLFVPGGERHSGFGHTLIIGPSYINNSKDDYSWGLHSAFRSEAAVLKLPAEIGFMLYDHFNNPSLFLTSLSTKPFSTAFASWIELGGTYGKVFYESEKHYFKWAATGNLLVGINGGYLDINKLDYTLNDTSTLVVHAMDATFAHAVNHEDESSFFALRGAGLSTTFGATYMHLRQRGGFDCNRSNDLLKKYDYRIGFSLMDLGMIRYFNEAIVSTIQTSSDRTWNGIDSVKFGSFTGFDTTLISNVGGTTEEKNFSILTPTAVSIQFDYAFTNRIYANVSVVNRIHIKPNQIARGNQVNLSARYERRKYEAALNFTLFEYKQPSLGLGLRYKFLVIGSDRLLQFLGLSDVRGFDFFFGLRFQSCIPPFKKKPADCASYW